jgi:hypothetical protein
MAEEAGARARTMQVRSNDYVTEWQAEIKGISDEGLRKTSQDRMTSAKTDFDEVASLAREAREAYQPYMQGLQDMENVLANDLTSAGIESARAQGNRTIADGRALNNKIAARQTELDQLSTKWSPKVER